jgi:hypothetical protein
MLKKPTNAPQQLAHLYNYQVTVLNSIRVDDEENEAESGQVCIRLSSPTDDTSNFENRLTSMQWNGFVTRTLQTHPTWSVYIWAQNTRHLQTVRHPLTQKKGAGVETQQRE